MKDNNKRPAQHLLQQYDLLKKHHKFLRESSSESEPSEEKEHKNKEEKRGQYLAKKYYDKLYKEYVLVNLKMFSIGQIGCRWRTEKEVLSGKGQVQCASMSCKNKTQNVFEMNFGYLQQQQKKNALVKVSVCKQCALKLNFKKKLKKIE